MSSKGNETSSTTPYTLASGSGPAAATDTLPSWSSVKGDSSVALLEEGDHPEYYMSRETQMRLKNDETLSKHDKMIIQHLALRKFHIPGHEYWEDYFFWFRNNHPFLCFWMADPRHPLGRRERIFNLLSSLAFGLAATCCVILWFYYQGDKRNFDNVAFSVFGYVNVTVGMLALLLFSGPLHVAFDLGLYFVQACPPCRPGGFFEKRNFPAWFQTFWLWMGAHVAMLITTASLALAIGVMLRRASIEEGDEDDANLAKSVKAYSFLLLYTLEVFVANFIVFPIGTFTMFSGILGCGRIPGIGGRPYQVRKHARMMEQKRAKQQKGFLI